MEWDFVANGAVDALEIVPENYRNYYVEDKANNRFILDDRVKPLAEAYTGVSKKLGEFSKSRQQDNAKDASRRHILKNITEVLKEVGVETDEGKLDEVPNLLKTKFSEFVEAQKNGGELKINLDKIKQDAEKRVVTEKENADKRLHAMQGSLEKYMVKSDAASALAEEKVVANGVDLLMPQITSSTRIIQDDNGEYVVRVVDREGNARMNNKGDWMTVRDLVKEFKTQFPMAFQSEAKQGSGKTPGSGNVSVAPTRGVEKSAVEKIAAGLSKMNR